MEFPEVLKQLRNERNIGQKELAASLGVSLKTVSHWETDYSEPSIAQLIALAKYFDVTVGELIGVEEI